MGGMDASPLVLRRRVRGGSSGAATGAIADHPAVTSGRREVSSRRRLQLHADVVAVGHARALIAWSWHD